MKFLFRFIFFLGFAGAVQAQDVTIRGGEHTDFSRLVLEFATTVPAWQFGRTESGYLLRFTDADLALETNGVYRRMSQDRILAVTFDRAEAELALAVQCECHADAFEFRGNRLVIDVKTGLPPEGSPFETAMDKPQEGLAEHEGAPTDDPQEVTLPAPAGLLGYDIVQQRRPPPTPEPIVPGDLDVQINLPLDPVGAGRNALLPPLRLNLSRPETSQAPDAVSANAEGAPEVPGSDVENGASDLRRREIEDLAASEISRAIAQGLLQPIAPVAPDPPADVPDIASTPALAVDPPEPPRIRVTTSADRDQFRPLDDGNGSECGLGTRITLRSWGDTQSPYLTVRDTRRSLLSEFDQPDGPSANAHVRALLFAGFGAEAHQQIKWFGEMIEDRHALDEIAMILDDRLTGGGNAFLGMEHCANSAAMWAILGAPDAVTLGRVNTQAVVAEAGGLPIHLRRILVPRLEAWFSEKGDQATAQALINTLGRAGESYDRLRSLTAEDTYESDGGDRASLMAMAQSGQENAPLALARLLDQLSKTSTPPPTPLVTLAEAYIVELNGTETSTLLLTALVRAHAAAGQLETAVAHLESRRARQLLNGEQRMNLWGSVIDSLTDKLAAAEFLKFVYRHRNEINQQPLTPERRFALVRRMADLGMVTIARELLSGDGANNPDVARAHADIALAEGDALAALEWIEGDTTPMAAGLRIRALGRLGRYDELSELAGDADLRMSSLWRSGDWQALREEASLPELRAAADLMIHSADGDEQPHKTPDLSEAATLLERSENTRRVIADLQDRFGTSSSP